MVQAKRFDSLRAIPRATKSDNRERIICMDDGNFGNKWASAERHGVFRNKIAVLSEADWNRILGAGGTPPRGYLHIQGDGNSAYIAYGKTALRYDAPTPEDAGRYLPYRGTGIPYNAMVLCAVLTEAYDYGSENVTVQATHPPKDIDYVRAGIELLQKALLGEWRITSYRGVREWGVKNVYPLDEPIAGVYAIVINEYGEWLDNDLESKTLLGIDAGGSTLDFSHLDEGLVVDYAPERLLSREKGTIQVLEAFERDMRTQYMKEFISMSRGIDNRRVEHALRNGIFRYGKKELSVKSLAKEHRNAFAEDVRIYVDRMGVGNYDDIYLTGGGMVFIENEVRKLFPHWHIYTAWQDPEQAIFANVFGMRNFFTYLRKNGQL